MGVSLPLLGVPGLMDDGGSILPLDIDFSTLPDGALPASLAGGTWSIVSGVAGNAPVPNDNKLTDPGLEATYTAGLCGTLTKTGSPTVAESADVHSGSKAQSFKATAAQDRLAFAGFTAAAEWVDARIWHKRAAGTGGNPRFIVDQVGGGQENRAFLYSTAWTERGFLIRLSAGLNTLTYPVYDFGTSGWDTVLVDDASLKPLTQSQLFTLLPAASTGDVVVKAMFNPQLIGGAGLAARANVRSNPTSFLIAWYYRFDSTIITIGVDQCVEGTWTALIAGTATGGLSASAWLELRCSGTNVSLFYNETQVGTTQTCNSALINNRHHGLFGSAGVACTRFFCSAYP